MKKGFTLIELLAVIVILAIIALIATPIVLNIIEDSKKSSMLRSVDFYLDAVEYTIADAVLHHGGIENGAYSIMENGNLCIGTLDDKVCSGDELIVEVNGEKPNSGTITIENGNIKDIAIDLNNKTIIKNSKGELVYKLAPGLYDENDKLLISREDLTSTEYKSFEINGEIVPILRVDDRGVLYSASDFGSSKNYGTEYLVGKLVIADIVTEIGNYAFYNCKSLTGVIIPESVTSIGIYAFSYCTSLKTINYKGTEENWNAISKDSAWDEDTPTDKVINYNYAG